MSSPSHGENRGSSPLGSANDFNILAPKWSLSLPASPTFLQWTVLQTISSRSRCDRRLEEAGSDLRGHQTDCTTAAGSRCATSRRSETVDDRLEDPPSDNAARSLLPALTTAPPPPSRLETRRAWCASSCPHSKRREAQLPVHTVALESKPQCAMIRRLIRGSLDCVHDAAQSSACEF